jgi:hypothetical protein
MAAINDKVMAMVERELKKDRKVATKALYDKAAKLDKGIGKLTPRQFNARYPLQVKRKLLPKKPRRRPTRRRTRKDIDRSAIRDVFLKFAKDLVEAEGKYEALDVITGVDRYVDEVAEIVG